MHRIQIEENKVMKIQTLKNLHVEITKHIELLKYTVSLITFTDNKWDSFSSAVQLNATEASLYKNTSRLNPAFYTDTQKD